MLVLSRKKNEVIRIGDDVSIVVVDVRGDRVRLGIEAPTGVSVHRAEVYDAIQRESHKEARKALETTDLMAFPEEPTL